jgi:hypothetical protein
MLFGEVLLSRVGPCGAQIRGEESNVEQIHRADVGDLLQCTLPQNEEFL